MVAWLLLETAFDFAGNFSGENRQRRSGHTKQGARSSVRTPMTVPCPASSRCISAIHIFRNYSRGLSNECPKCLSALMVVWICQLNCLIKKLNASLKRLSALMVVWMVEEALKNQEAVIVSQTPFGFDGGLDCLILDGQSVNVGKLSQTPFGFDGGLDSCSAPRRLRLVPGSQTPFGFDGCLDSSRRWRVTGSLNFSLKRLSALMVVWIIAMSNIVVSVFAVSNAFRL